MAAGNRNDTTDINKAELSWALRSCDLEATTSMSLSIHQYGCRVEHAGSVTHRFVVIFLVALVNHVLHLVVIDEERLGVAETNVLVINVLRLFLKAVVPVRTQDDTVYVPMPDVM